MLINYLFKNKRVNPLRRKIGYQANIILKFFIFKYF